MSDYVVWLDSENAKIFALKPSGIENSHLEKKAHKDHHNQGSKDKHGDPAQEHFFHEVALKIKDADQVLILGPGLAKIHFKSHLENHHHQDLGKKIIGMENSDHPHDKQILASARQFFTKYHLFNNPV